MMFYSILALSVFLISLLGTRLTILALRKSTLLLDRPNFRSNHETPTPRGGGIAVIIAIVIGMMIADVGYSIVIAVFLLAAVSLLDDLIEVPAFVRLLVQSLAVSLPLSTMDGALFYGVLPGWVDKGLTAILWIWFTNLFNFMDGIDGLSTTEMICIGFGLCLLAAFDNVFPNDFSVYGLVLGAAACGFWWWNRHPAKIFLGDVGSVPIGFVTGYLLLLAVRSDYTASAVILPAYYLADSTITLLRRLYQGKKIWVAHSEHYYQRAVRKGRRHDRVVNYILGINLLLILLATLSAITPSIGYICVATAYLVVFMLLGFFAHTDVNPRHEPF